MTCALFKHPIVFLSIQIGCVTLTSNMTIVEEKSGPKHSLFPDPTTDADKKSVRSEQLDAG
jgi:hypothetical protein